MTSFGTVISYPIPPYSNVPIESDFYQPSQFFISNITLGQMTLVTTTINMNYVVGQLVRLLIPSSFGCIELNQREGFVFSIPAPNQVEVGIDSSQNVSAFTASSASTQPQIIPIGDVNTGSINASGRLMNKTFIPGSFINISPQ
jgi:hypothetical protein